MGEFKEVKFKGVVVPVGGLDRDYLSVVREDYSDLQTSNIEILDFFPEYACEFYDDPDMCPYECEYRVNGKCNPPKYEVEITVKYRKVSGGGGW